MFEIFNQAIFYLLSSIKLLTGSYGLSIVLVTLLLRVVLWPMNTAQTRSMRKMQQLQPKLKQLQEKYKDNPIKLQEAMMGFYKENQFNPMAGCLPMLVQIPIFIGLYGALNSPDFMAVAGGERFLFIEKLDHSLQSYAGESMDNLFSVKENDKFTLGRKVAITLKNGHTKEHLVKNPAQSVIVRPQPILPGEPITLRLNLSEMGLSPEYVELVKAMDVSVVDQGSRELEQLTFVPSNKGNLIASIPTVPGKPHLHLDVLVLIAVYGLLTVLYQKVMQHDSPAPSDPAQAKMMKLLPLMFVVMLFFIPIPAGVMLYLVVTMLLMFAQTWWVNHSDTETTQKNPPKPSTQVVDVTPQ